MKKIIFAIVFGINLSMNAVISDDEYFDSARSEGNKTVAEAIYHVLTGKTQSKALRDFKKTFQSDPKPAAGGGVDLSQASKEFREKLEAAKTEEQKIALFSDLFTDPKLSGHKAIAALNAKETDLKFQDAVKNAKIAAKAAIGN
ncbi:MAG: hypothetical protein WC707_04490 [Candidatus Babeliaceae bacterium]|jgi:cytochrome c peroxidase